MPQRGSTSVCKFKRGLGKKERVFEGGGWYPNAQNDLNIAVEDLHHIEYQAKSRCKEWVLERPF